MKTTHLISLGMVAMATLFYHPVAAQKGEPALLHMIYEFIHIDDLNNPDDPIKETIWELSGLPEMSCLPNRIKTA